MKPDVVVSMSLWWAPGTGQGGSRPTDTHQNDLLLSVLESKNAPTHCTCAGYLSQLRVNV